MSGIAVVFSRDGRPADPAALDLMLDEMRHRGRDGRTSQLIGPLAMGAQLWWSTPEDVGVNQPVCHEFGPTSVVFDGRIDNRDDVLDALGDNFAGHARDARVTISDAHLVLLAHDRWGDACFERFVGSFVLALHDREQRSVKLVRDQLGSRTLFYYLDADVLIVASEEHAVVAHPTVSDRLDETMLVHHIALLPSTEGATYFADVREILPAHMLTVTTDGLSARHYWRAEPKPTLRGLTDEDYAERFRDHLREAVRCRLRSTDPVAVQMSGGYDSTSVAAMAAAELAESGNRLRTYSWVFNELAECDESRYIAAAAEALGLDAVTFGGDDAWPLREWRDLPRHPGRPDWNSYRYLKTRLHKRSHDGGHDVLLTGAFGNHVFCGWEHHLADLLAEGRIVDAVRNLTATARDSGARLAVLGPWSRRVAGRVLDTLPGGRRLRPRHEVTYYPWWLSPDAELLLARDRTWPVNLADTQRYEQHFAAVGMIASLSASYEAPFTCRCGIELRHPYRDRRLVEFMLAIPAHQLYNGGRRKYIVNRAMRGLLPEQVLRRRDFTSISRLHDLGLYDRESAEFTRLVESSEGLWRASVAPETLHEIAADPSGEHRGTSAELVRWQCANLGMWRETH